MRFRLWDRCNRFGGFTRYTHIHRTMLVFVVLQATQRKHIYRNRHQRISIMRIQFVSRAQQSDFSKFDCGKRNPFSWEFFPVRLQTRQRRAGVAPPAELIGLIGLANSSSIFLLLDLTHHSALPNWKFSSIKREMSSHSATEHSLF